MKRITIIVVFLALFGILSSSIIQAAPLSQNNSYDYQLIDVRLNEQSIISSSNPTIQGTLPQIVEVVVRNTGTETWTRTPNSKGCAVHMGTDQDLANYFYHPGYDGWLETSDNSNNTYKGRRVLLAEESTTVLPGQQATFRFKLHIPTNTDKDTRTHKWNLVWEGSDSQCDNPQWFAHAPLSFQITLSNSKYSLVSAEQTEENGKNYAIITVRNEGPRVWYKEEQSLCKTFDPAKPDYCYYDQKAYRLATGLFDVKSDSNPYRVQDHVSPLYVENGEGWYSNNRVSPQENTVSPGQTATFKFALAKVSEPIRVYFTPVLEYAAWMQGDEIAIDVESSQSTVNQAPTAPTNLRYESYENNKLKLSWDKAIDDSLPQDSQIRYWIQVIRNRDGQIAEEKWTILDNHYIWPFDPVADVGTHRWRVKAWDGALESDWSAEGTITIAAQQSCQASPFTVESNLRDMVNVNVTGAQLDDYIRSQRPTSPLIGMGNDWLKIGRKYGINAIYIMAHAIHESDFGFSQIAQDKNNLFGYGAKDSCAYACAWTYTSKTASVDQVMHNVNRDYLTHGGAFYNGPTLQGMNVKYASDKKWSEKIALYMNQAATHIGLTSCGLSNQPTADVTTPNGRITAPTEGANIQANRLTIEAEASDADSGVAYVQFNVNYGGRWLEIGKDSSPPYQVNWSVPNGVGSQLIHFGIHIVDKAGLIAYDPEGNVRTVFIESTANPSVKENWIPEERRAYLNQRSLGVYGDSMCGSASAAMILAMNGLIEKDYQTMYKVANAIYPNTIGAGGNIWMWQIAQQMTQRGLPSTVRSFGSSQTEWDTIKAEIDAGHPVFMASWKVTTGHFFVVVGYNEKSGEHQLIVYDPFGKWAGVKNRYNVNSYAASSHKGQWVTYNFEAVRGGHLIITQAQRRHLLPRQGQPSNPDRVSDEPETIQPYDGVPIEVAASTPSNNLLINGDFEQGLTGWKIWGNKNTTTVVTNTVYSGTTAIRSEQRLTAVDEAQWQGIEQTVPITGGRIYIISARLNFQDTMGLHLKVEYRDRDNKRITEQLFKFPTNVSNGWLELGGPIIAPDEANRAVITVLHGTNGKENVSGGVVFIDQLSFTLTDCPDFTLCNGDFEQGLKNWYSSSTANIVAGGSYNGTTAIQSKQSYQANQARIWSGLRQIVKVVPGQTYQVCVQTKRENSVELHVKMESFNSNQQNVEPLGEDIIVTNLDGNSDGWEKHCESVTAPAQADHANLAIWHGVLNDETNVPGGVVWIDDVTFTPTDNRSITINNGDSTTNQLQVTLSLEATNAISMIIANDGTAWSADSLGSGTGILVPDVDSWSGSVRQATPADGEGYVIFGPYTYKLPQNKPMCAEFKLKVSDNSLMETVVKLEVVDYTRIDADNAQLRTLALRSLKGTDFIGSNQYQTFCLEFTYPGINDSGVEFRVWTYAKTDVTVDRVIVYEGPQPLSETVPHTLNDKAGERWVGVKYQDAASNWSQLYTDTITVACPERSCNSGFEDGLAFWTQLRFLSEAGRVIPNGYITTSGRTGNALAIINDGANADNNQLLSGVFEAGKSYRASVWCKAEIGDQCKLFFGDANNEFGTAYENQVNIERPGTGDWQKLIVTLTPSRDERLNIYLYAQASANPVLYDDIVIEEPSLHSPGLYITKTASTDIVQQGETVTFQVSVTHNLTTPIRLTDTLPAGLTYVEGTVVVAGLNPHTIPNKVCQVDGQQLICEGTLAAEATISYQAKIDSNVTKGSVFYNSAEVTSGPYWNGAAVAVVYPDPAFIETLIMLYASGDNNLDPDITTALNRAELGLHQSSARVLMVVDWLGDDNAYLYWLQADTDMGCPNAVNPTCNGRYKLGQNMWEWDENMGSHYSLLEFLRSMKKAYPNAKNVDQVILSLIGHGGGPIPELLAGQPASHTGQPASHTGQPASHTGQPASHTGQPVGGWLWDSNPGSSLTVTELGYALELYKQDTGQNIALLYLDMCLMATSEVVDEIAGSVDYLLASENWAWATFPYDKLVGAVDGKKDGRAIGEAWLDIEINQLQGDVYPYTFSLIDVVQVTQFKESLNPFSAVLRPYATTAAGRAAIKQAMSQTSCFDSNQDGLINEADNYCDVADFARQIKRILADDAKVVGAAQRLISTIEQLVIKEAHQDGVPVSYDNQKWVWNQLGGVSIYMPLQQDNWKRTHYTAERFDFAEDTQWDEFLAAYWNNAEPPAGPTACEKDCVLPDGVLPIGINIDFNVTIINNEITLNWSGDGDTVYNIHQGMVNSITHRIEWNQLADQVSGGKYTVPQNGLTQGGEYCYQLRTVDNEKAVSVIPCVLYDTQLKLVIPNQNAMPDSLINAWVNIENANNLCVGAGNVTIIYDPAIVKATGKVAATGLSNGYQFKTFIPEPGTLRIAFVDQQCQPLYGNGTLMRVEFETIGQQGQQTALQFIKGFTQTVIYDKQDLDTALAVALKSGQLTLNSRYISGDVNGKDGVNGADALLALQIAAGQLTPTSPAKQACDVTGDGFCRAADATLILCFAATQDWSRCTGQSTPRQLNLEPAVLEKVKVCVGAISGQSGDTVTIPVRVKNAPEMAGVDLALRYGEQAITPLSVSPTDVTSQFKMTHNLTDTGVIRVSMAHDTPLQTQSEVTLFNITMRLNQPEYDLTVSELYLNDVAGLDFASNLQREIETGKCGSLSVNFLPIVIK